MNRKKPMTAKPKPTPKRSRQVIHAIEWRPLGGDWESLIARPHEQKSLILKMLADRKEARFSRSAVQGMEYRYVKYVPVASRRK
jgi:hypothetical protein